MLKWESEHNTDRPFTFRDRNKNHSFLKILERLVYGTHEFSFPNFQFQKDIASHV